MDSGIYTSAVGMLDEFNVEDNIANNLANMQTPGFKERSAVQQNFSELLYASQPPAGTDLVSSDTPIGRFGRAPLIDSYGLDLAQGSPRYTGSPLDLMIVGDGFFRVRAGRQTLLTRNGSFRRSAAGFLVTQDDYQVLGDKGQPIKVPSGVLAVDKQGGIAVDGRRIGQLGMARVQAGQPLTATGNGYYMGPGRPLTRPQSTAVLQGYLETSNVDLSTQTSAMMSAQRAYEANSRLLQMQDEALSLAVGDVGKVST